MPTKYSRTGSHSIELSLKPRNSSLSQSTLFVVEHLYPLGPAQLLFPLAKELASTGHDIAVAVLGQRTDATDHWQSAGVRVFHVNGDDRTPLHTYRDAITVIRELKNLIRIVSPDRVHAWCGDSIWLTLLATEPLPLFKPLPEFQLLATELNMHPQKRFWRSVLEDRMSSRIDTLVVPHGSIADDLRDAGIVAQGTVVIPNGIRIGETCPEHRAAMVDRGALSRKNLRDRIRKSLHLPQTARLAIAVADLEPRNRLKDLVWATDLLACVRDDFHFAVIGKGRQLWRLRRFAAQTEAKQNVHFLGLPDRPELYLAAADFYWHSHQQSPLSADLLEAMAMGVPAICVLNEGTSAIVKHQETGFAVNYGARDEFARWTKYLIEQAEPASRLAQQGQQHVLNNFAFDNMFKGYQQLYELGT